MSGGAEALTIEHREKKRTEDGGWRIAQTCFALSSIFYLLSSRLLPTSPPVHPLRLFFFQAEDGIRVLYVTGVQTCALPISSGMHSTGHEGELADLLRHAVLPAFTAALIPMAVILRRSEERRVGKSVDVGGCGGINNRTP